MVEPRVLDAFAHLNRVGAEINQFELDDLVIIRTMLKQISSSAAEIVPGSSAVITLIGDKGTEIDNQPIVSVEGTKATGLTDFEIPEGMGMRAVERRKRVLSYEEVWPEKAGLAQGQSENYIACFPLSSRGEVLAVLYICLNEDRRFSDLELLMLDNYANLAAMNLLLALQQYQAQQEQLQKERELRRLRRAGMLLSSRTGLKDTLDTILQVALEVTDAIYGIFRLVDNSGKYLVCEAISGVGLSQPAIEVLPIDGQSVMAWVAKRREPVIVSDLRQESWGQVYYPFDRELEMRSELAVPLIGASGRLEGVLNLESPSVNAFDKQDRYILQILASQAVVSIQEVRLLNALQDISLMLSRYSLPDLFHYLVERGCDLLNAPYGMIWLRDKDTLVLQAVQTPEIEGEPIMIPEGGAANKPATRLKMEDSLAGRAVLEGVPITFLANDTSTVIEYLDLQYLHGSGSALCVPLYSSPAGSPVGAFCIHSGPDDDRDFSQSDWDKKVLEILGHYATLASQLSDQQEALRVAQDQRALTEAFAAIGDIAANLLHRLNNKIGTIPVRVEGIQDKCAPLLASDNYLEKNLFEIQHSATDAMTVVRESLVHLHPIQLAPVSVARSVSEALKGVRIPLGVEVAAEGLEILPPVQAGSTRLDLVFINLIENAVDAMMEKGGTGWKIQISGTAANGWVRILVSDNGPGIPPQLHERIFEFNYSSRASAHPGKLGFGLWWVKSLIVRFGGNISVESDGNTGTTFILNLPQARGSELE